MKHLKIINSLFVVWVMIGGASSLFAQADKPPYLSPVPRMSYPNTLAEQEAQLKKDPLMIRFAESRTKQAADRYRPLYHFVSPESRLNDPNGLSYWNGNWHLFYQAYPPEDTRQHWGHAVSKDLVQWRDLPYAIYPSPERAVYSGAAWVEKDRVVAMYHGTGVGNMIATSSDPLLLNWDKQTQPAIPSKSTTGFAQSYSVFDPTIWKENGIYYSLSAGKTEAKTSGKYFGTASLFSSKDLQHWEYMHEFVQGDRFTRIGDDFACPYFLPLGDKYIMPFYSHMSGGQYLIGKYDSTKHVFIPSNHGRFNFGASGPGGVHAPSATTDGKGNVVIMFNMNPGKPTGEWNQIMSLPRLLTLSGQDEVLQQPMGDLESLRYNHRVVKPMKLQANKETVLPGISGNAMEIIAKIDPGKANVIELNVLRSPGKEEYTRITLYPGRGLSNGLLYKAEEGTAFMPFDLLPLVTGGARQPRPPFTRASIISLDNANSSSLPDAQSRPPEVAPFLLAQDEPITLRIFIDRSVVEVFVNDKQCVALRVYPGRNDSQGVSIKAVGQDASLLSLDAWQMKSIY
ncbi:MAG: glycoside hydrolase family 32 protein [Cytophagales bacterium]|nr:glycoside hydrolase family 32 protein [Cytophagales bacterium]